MPWFYLLPYNIISNVTCLSFGQDIWRTNSDFKGSFDDFINGFNLRVYTFTGLTNTCLDSIPKVKEVVSLKEVGMGSALEVICIYYLQNR